MTDIFGQYKSQETRTLGYIDSTKYPDTNKDLEANLRRLNSFVDYLAQYIGTMQKGVDQASQDVLQRGRSILSNLTILLGGGSITDINFGDLQYFLPAIGALLGFDSSTPFPINLFNAAEHFLLGYVVPLDSWNIAIEDVIDNFMTALGLNDDFIAAVHLVLDNAARFTNDLTGLFNDLTGFLGVFNIFDFTGTGGTLGTLWSTFSGLISNFNVGSLGAIADPFLETLTPWLSALGTIIGVVDDILEAFTGGIGGGTGSLSNPLNWLTDLLGMFGGLLGLGTGSPSIFNINNIPILGPLITALFAGFTGTVESGDQPTPDQVQSVTGGQSQAVAAIAAEIAKIKLQLADPLLVVAEADFEEPVTADALALWDIVNIGPETAGTLSTDGHQLTTIPSGAQEQEWILRFTGTNGEAPVDDMLIEAVIGDQTLPFPTFGHPSSFIELHGRQHASDGSRVRLRLYASSFALSSFNTTTETVIASGSLSVNPGSGSLFSLQCGTDAGHRYFTVSVNGASTTYFDGASASLYGTDYRWRGVGVGDGTVSWFAITYQVATGYIAHWVSTSLAS